MDISIQKITTIYYYVTTKSIMFQAFILIFYALYMCLIYNKSLLKSNSFTALLKNRLLA